jgi:tetratricopeptide (TPR) repeat protein
MTDIIASEPDSAVRRRVQPAATMRLAALLMGLAVPMTMTTGVGFAQDAAAPAAEEQVEARARPFDAREVGSFAGAFLAARTADVDRDAEAAIDFYSRALSFDQSNTDLQQRLMIAQFTAGRFSEGLKIAARLKDDPAVERVTKLALAIDGIAKREYRTAEALLAYEGANDLDRLLNGLMRAWARFGSGEPDQALRMIDELQGPEWFAIFLNFHGGAMAAASGKRDEARARYNAVITDMTGGGAAPDTYMRAVIALAGLEARGGNRQGALDAVATGEQFSPGYAPLTAVRQSIENGTPLEPQIGNAQQGAAAVLHTIASALNRGGAEEIVSLYLQLSRALDPANAATLVLLGGLAETLGKPEDAIAIYESVPENSPMRRVAQLQLGLNLADLDRLDEAKAHLERLIEADPTDMRSYLAYGSVLSSAKQYDEMAANFERAVEAIDGPPNRNHWNIYFQRGIAYERLKEWERAEPNFLTALELFPEQPQVLNYLGYSWVDMDMNLEEGLDMIQRAVELRPNDGYIVDSLGWAHYRMGDFEAAVTELERSVELMPADPTINDHLGDAYWRVGRRLEAVFQWNRALSLEPEEDLIPLIEAKIADGMPEMETPAPSTADDAGRGSRTNADPT